MSVNGHKVESVQEILGASAASSIAMEDLANSFGASDDYATVLTEAIARHQASAVGSVAPFLLLLKWHYRLAPFMRQQTYIQNMISDVQALNAKAADIHQLVKALESVSMIKNLRGIDIIGKGGGG